MLKALSKSLARSTLIALAISSLPALAAYNDDADCAAVSNGARSSAQRATEAIDQAAKTTGAAVEQAKACVDTLVASGTRTISDFGGGVQIPDSIRKSLAQQGCKVLSSVQTQISSKVQQAAGDAVSQLPGAIQPYAGRAANTGLGQATTLGTSAVQNQISTPPAGQAGQTPAPAISVFQRLANIF